MQPKFSNSTYDYIIAGAGASGLSLAWYLMQSGILSDKKVLLIDKSLSPQNDKTWCFWDDTALPEKKLIHHSWNTLQVRAFDQVYTETLNRYQYHCMRSFDYAKFMIDAALKHKSFTLLEASINKFDSSDSRAMVFTDMGNFSADWIFQSALKPGNFDSRTVDISLKQHFLGVEIETKLPVFNPEEVMLMDFDTSQLHGVTFFYVLPFSETSALVEYTFFTKHVLSKEEYQTGILEYLRKRYSLGEGDYSITRTEMGSIPMEDRRYNPWYTNRVLNMGTIGGLTKPSTGYTFTRIHRHCKLITEALKEGKTPPPGNDSGYRFRVYDIMLLYLLESDPAVSKRIFRDLFKKNSFDRILQFLEEDTHPGQELSIFASLPPIPFLKAIYKMKHRIFTGA